MTEMHCQYCYSNNPVLREDCDNMICREFFKSTSMAKYNFIGLPALRPTSTIIIMCRHLRILIMLAYRYFVILQSFPGIVYHLELPRFPVLFFHIFKNNRMEVMLHYNTELYLV